jgi:hypothetical protein
MPGPRLGVMAPSVAQPSAVRTAWYGAWLWCALPSRCGTSPVANHRPASQTASDTPDSMSDTSMDCPSPVRARSCSAARTPIAR